MADYNYVDALKEDIKNYIEENGIDIKTLGDGDRDSAESALNDDLWVEDSVTGNGSGSYTFDREQAKEYLFDSSDGMELLKEAVSEYGIEAETIADKMMGEDWEWFDVTIRCYALYQAISEVFDELWDEEE